MGWINRLQKYYFSYPFTIFKQVKIISIKFYIINNEIENYFMEYDLDLLFFEEFIL